MRITVTLQEYKLSASLVFTQVARRLTKDCQYDQIRQFVQHVSDSRLCDDQSQDEIIGACVRIIADNPKEVRIFPSLL